MQKQISYTTVVIFLFFTSCASSKKKAAETTTTIYTTEVALEQPTAQDTIATVQPVQGQKLEKAISSENYDPADGGGATPKQIREISPAEKEKIKQIMRERMKLKVKKTN
jgi:hypothetical protein